MKYTAIVIDDSALMRGLLRDMINSIEDFEVVAVATDAYDAREKIKAFEPDFVTIDINMPKMDGISFLKNLMRLHPMPSIVISSITDKQHEVFEDGAIGFVPKKSEKESNDDFFKRLKDTLLSYTFLFDRYKQKKPKPTKSTELVELKVEEKLHPDIFLPKKPNPIKGRKVIAIGSSTGGIEVLLRIFAALPSGTPPILISQHIPYGFSKSFAQRLDAISVVSVKEVEDGDELLSGFAYLAPGNKHLLLDINENKRYIARVVDGPKISRHKPSVDLLFRSVNNIAGAGAMAIILTGMGDDGAIGIKELYDNGAYTIAQDEASCTVFGMPKRAIEAGGVRDILTIDEIAQKIIYFSTN